MARPFLRSLLISLASLTSLFLLLERLDAVAFVTSAACSETFEADDVEQDRRLDPAAGDQFLCKCRVDAHSD